MSFTALCLSLLFAQAPPPGLAEDISKIASRTFEIPIRLAPGRSDDIAKLRLWVSRDKGLTWRKVETVLATQQRFKFQAPADGLYWFGVQVIDKDAKAEPERMSAATVALKVLVETAVAKREVRKPPSDKEVIQGLRKELAQLQARQKELEKRLAEYEKRQRGNR